MGINDFLLNKNKEDKSKKVVPKDEGEAMRMDFAFNQPAKLEKVELLSTGVNKKLIKEVKLVFQSDKVFEKFKKISKCYTYPDLKVLAEDNDWIMDAIEAELKRKLKEKKNARR